MLVDLDCGARELLRLGVARLLGHQTGQRAHRLARSPPLYLPVILQPAEQGAPHVGLAFGEPALQRLHAPLAGCHGVDGRLPGSLAAAGSSMSPTWLSAFAIEIGGAVVSQLGVADSALGTSNSRALPFSTRASQAEPLLSRFFQASGFLQQRPVLLDVDLGLLDVAHGEIGDGDAQIDAEAAALAFFDLLELLRIWFSMTIDFLYSPIERCRPDRYCCQRLTCRT